MKLFFKKVGEGKPLIILHGLFGLGDNWSTLSRSFSERGFCCYLVDLRNHGRSPHSFEFNYDVMADDIREFMDEEKIERADIIGHSMGGKTAMFFALKYPERTRKMIVVDIAPKYYPQHLQSVFSALKSIDTTSLTSRKEAEEKLRQALKDEAMIQFLLKNLYWTAATSNMTSVLKWRFGFPEIEKNNEAVGEAVPMNKSVNIPVLFLRGERSGYIVDDDANDIKKIFPNSEIKTVPDAGHWVHAENPVVFLEMVLEFLSLGHHI